MDFSKLTIKQARDLMKEGKLTAIALAEYYLKNIKEKNPEINAYLEVFADVIDQAKKADEIIQSDKNAFDNKPLLGIPFAIKDNILIKGRHAGAASKVLEGYIASYNSTAMEKLLNAGAVVIGRVNMDEFAMGGSTENSAYGVSKNPIDTSRVAGGSSGGSAASVAMNGALAALGSDTGGSIRQPSAFCGVVGLKPTYGSVSRHGLMAMGSSLDVIGPITKSVEDSEIIFDVIKGNDAFDSTSLSEKEISDLNSKSGAKKEKFKIGIVPELLNMGGLSSEVVENFKLSVEKLKSAGYEIVDIKLPNIGYSLAVYYVLMPAEVSSNMARFDGVKYGPRVSGDDLLGDYINTRGQLLGKEVRRRILLGTYVLSTGYYDAYYNKANIVRQLISEDFKKAFEEVDVILTPTTPSSAFKIGEKADDPIAMYLEDIFTVTANLVGVPAISIPSGFTKDNLPLGIQFTAPHACEDVLFKIGKDFENSR